MNETIHTVQDNANRPDPFAPLLNSPGSLSLAQSAKEQSTEIPDDELSPSALKKRQERRLCERWSSQDSQSPSLSSSISNSTLPTALTVVNTAELALSDQRDNIPEEKWAIEVNEIVKTLNRDVTTSFRNEKKAEEKSAIESQIVKTLAEGNFVEATKES